MVGALVLGMVLLGCADSESMGSSTTDDTDTTEAEATDTAEATDGGADGENYIQPLTLGDERLEVTLPEGWDIQRGSGSATGEGCQVTGASFGPDGEPAALQVDLVSDGCRQEDDEIGNGEHGVYVDIEQVDAPESPETFDTPVGSAVSFTQTYTECTNECEDYEEPVVLVRLAEPAEPDEATVMMYSPKGVIDRSQLVDIAETLQPAG